MALRRALHFVFKVGDRSRTAVFYRDVLGMKASQCVCETRINLKRGCVIMHAERTLFISELLKNKPLTISEICSLLLIAMCRFYAMRSLKRAVRQRVMGE